MAAAALRGAGWASGLVAIALLGSACGPPDSSAAAPTPTAVTIPTASLPATSSPSTPTTAGARPGGGGAPIQANESVVTAVVVSVAPFQRTRVATGWLMELLLQASQDVPGVPNLAKGSVGELVTAETEENVAGLELGTTITAQVVFLGEAGRGRFWATSVQPLAPGTRAPEVGVRPNRSLIQGEVRGVQPRATGAQPWAVTLTLTNAEVSPPLASYLPQGKVGTTLMILTGEALAGTLRPGQLISAEVSLQRSDTLTGLIGSSIRLAP